MLAGRLSRAIYRVGQGMQALAGQVDAAERAEAMAWLPTAARVAFQQMPAAYQRHHLTVYRRVRQAGCRDGDVLAAALLHDIGKIDGQRRMWLWQRVAVVLLQPWPGLVERLAAEPAPGWRHGFLLHARHPRLGAARAAALGCSARTVALIAHHQTGDLDDPGLARLRAADDAA